MIHPLLLAVSIMLAAIAPRDLATGFERSGGTRTDSYAETIGLCERLDRASSYVHFESFGTSGEGRALPVLIVDADGHRDPGRILRSRKAVVMIQAGIHAGEIDGKDAGLMLVREIAVDGSLRGLLDRVTIVFIPIFNVDGHERSGPFNRPNQNGPENMGFRANATNLNLNRDFIKADAPETRAWLSLFNRWQPDLFIDCHVTDGADYQHVMTYVVEAWQNADPGVAEWARTRFEPALVSRMRAAGYPLAPFCDFRTEHDPHSGLKSFASTPRFSTGYAALRNRVALLIETHMIKDYAARVRGTHRMLVEALSIANNDADGLLAAVAGADRRAAGDSYRREALALDWTASFVDSVMIEFLAYKYTVAKSALTGGNWYRYTAEPETLRVPYFHTQTVTSQATLPQAYAIPPQWSEVIQRVRDHGLAYFTLRERVTLPVSTARFRDVQWADAPYEGRHPLTYAWDEIEEERTLEPGTVIVDLAQPAARLAAHLFEPAGPDALVRWGFFDASFEQKEYIESYVIERIAREMLDADSTLAGEFEEMLKNQEFAANPRWIRQWFYQRTPYFDTRPGIYPVARILDRATVDRLARAAR